MGTALAALLTATGLLVAAAWAAPASAEGEGPDLCKEFQWGCFTAGTYGRVHPSWNLRGGPGRPANLVSHGTRLELPPYAEVDLYYRKTFDDLPQDVEHPIQVGAVITLAFLEDLFHFTGDFDQSFALRNLYGWTSGLLGGRLGLWAGSRMYRGDDIYLFDYWPLDNLNTYGGGAELTLKPVRIALHVGPAHKVTDPVCEVTMYTGGHFTRAARMEPVTPPGHVYVSQAFAALAAIEQISDFRCDYVGTVPLAKKYGSMAAYHLQRA